MLKKRTTNLCSSFAGILAGGVACGLAAGRKGKGARAPRPAAGVRPFSAQILRWLWAALLMLCLAPLQALAVQNGDRIINYAELTTSEALPYPATATVTVSTTVAPPKIEFLKYAPTAPGAVNESVQTTWYRTAGDPSATFQKMSDLSLPGQNSSTNLPAMLPLVVTNVFHQCEPVFVRVTDASQNLDHSAPDTVTVTITEPKTSVTQVLRLTETGNDTGVFVGYIVTTGAVCTNTTPPSSYNGFLPASESTAISATFVDAVTGDQASNNAVIDPLGIVFNSYNGAPIDGVSVTLLDASTGNPATVYGDDGVSAFPATIVTGSTASDSSGRRYDFPPGGFRFPFVTPGNYRFKVVQPPAFVIPSAKPDSALQNLPGGPFAIATGSRLEQFVINPGPALHIDIPADPIPASLWVQKTAGKTTAAIGDFVPYQIDVTNGHPSATAFGTIVTDNLPLGFRYRRGSSTIKGTAAPDPQISSDGRTLTYTVGDILPGGTVSIKFVVEVAAGAKPGVATNYASARSLATASNTAQAAVQVQSDFLNSHSILMGRVGRGPCNLDWDEGVEGVRIYLEDGTFVVTDKHGMYHFEGVRPGTHVVQLDLDSLREGFEVYSCEENTRFAGRSFSQFVDLQGGSMWRVDFRAGKPDDALLYRKRIEERLAAEKAAAEKIRKEAEAARLAAEAKKKAAEAPKKVVEQEEEYPKDDWAPAPSPAKKEEADEEIPADDWATPPPQHPSTEKTAVTVSEAAPAVVRGAEAPTDVGAASLELRSTLEQGRVILTPTVTVPSPSPASQRLEVELPRGVVYAAGSATRDGSPIPDPQIAAGKLTFPLDHAAAGTSINLRFAADFSADAPSGEYITRAVFIYSDAKGPDRRTPYADNVIVRIREEERSKLPAMTLRPHFKTFSTELAPEELAVLDEAVRQINGYKVRQILLVGHTDNVPIAARSRNIHRDNTALSAGRALSVARYLKERLRLTPAQISASGKGESVPVASNRTAEGRTLNRRVEVVILTERVTERMKTRLHKEKSGVVHGEAIAAVPAPAKMEQAGPVPVSAPHAEKPGTTPAPVQQAATRPVRPLPADPAEERLQPPPATVRLPAQPAPSPAEPFAGGLRPLPVSAFDYLLDSASVSASADETDAQGKEDQPKLTKLGILSPEDGASMPDAISAVRVVLASTLTPRLLVDGKEIPAERIGFTMREEKTGNTLYSYIGVNFGEPGEHTLEIQGTDSFGLARFQRSLHVTRTGPITTIRFLSGEGNVADGKTPVRLKLELVDSFGKVIHASTELQIGEGSLRPLKKESLFPDALPDKTERVVVDKEGYALFQPVAASGLYRTVLSAGKARVEAETYVKPDLRKSWILVGMGEETVGYNAVAGHMENLRQAGEDENLYENGRLAFYAKGTVKGEWLLTMSYDSAKPDPDKNGLFQTIDPNTYYTLYGDASQQQYDAASARKIYLKIERDQFYALFGDYDTGLTVTELSRYSRRLNGLKAEWQGKNFEANVFGTDSAQAYARDELRGDGTSGIYRLSHNNLVLNSEKVTIQVRDRFRSEIIVNSKVMTRFADYNIDYASGTVLFKEPISTRDENFNPIYIVVEYEVVGGGTEALTYGGRVGAKLLDNRLKTGFTYIHEGQMSGEGNSYGGDVTYKLGAGTTFKGEVAHTDTNFGGVTKEGNGYLAEVQQSSKDLQGRVYFREQEVGFGLGQQNGSETGTKKTGLDAAYKVTEAIALTGQAYRQYNLNTNGNAVQDVIEERTNYTSGPYTAHLGFRHASDSLGDGSGAKTSEQLTAGAGWLTLDKRLTLRVDHDQSLGGNDNASFPTRTTVGADYKLNPKVTLFAQQELTSGSASKTNTTQVGMKSTPWEGGAVNTSFDRNLNENSDRLFALFGLKQVWKINDKWSVDGGLDRSQTISSSQNYTFNVNAPPASGENGNFTAISLGSSYKEKKWSWDNRIEFRTSTTEDKWGVQSGFVGEPKDGWGCSARLQLFDTKSSVDQSSGGTDSVTGDLRLGMVYRPPLTRWIILDRLDLLYNQQMVTGTKTESRRIVNNLSANFKPDGRTQISFLYGAKYVLETIDAHDYSGYTDLVGIEGRYDLTKEWDVGLRGSVLHSWNAGQLNYSAGPSVGYNVVKNAWISLGYNVAGFTDKDFSAGDYTAQGPFIRFRFKFDQNSVREAVNWISHE